jgi:hypothetical protein
MNECFTVRANVCTYIVRRFGFSTEPNPVPRIYTVAETNYLLKGSFFFFEPLPPVETFTRSRTT